MNAVPLLSTPVDVMRNGLSAANVKADVTPVHPVQLIQAQVLTRSVDQAVVGGGRKRY